jgi:hypothetical protein
VSHAVLQCVHHRWLVRVEQALGSVVQLTQEEPNWGDEEVFQGARK